MHTWRTDTETLILNIFKGNMGKMCLNGYKCLYNYRNILLPCSACLANFSFIQNKQVRSFIIMNQGNEVNQQIYLSGMFSFPLSKILVQLFPILQLSDKSKDGIKMYLPLRYS